MDLLLGLRAGGRAGAFQTRPAGKKFPATTIVAGHDLQAASLAAKRAIGFAPDDPAWMSASLAVRACALWAASTGWTGPCLAGTRIARGGAVLLSTQTLEIAERLALGEKTVKGHVSNILGKRHLAGQTQAAVFGWREGLVRRA